MLQWPLSQFAELPLLLLAQAGGGGSFGGSGGGGGGGSGGGGDGGGGGEAIFWLIQFTIRYPHYGIPICVVIAVSFYYGRKAESGSRMARTIRRGRKVQEQQLRESAISSVQQRDPTFTEEVFLQRVINSFTTTQSAWSEQDLSRCRAFISDGVRERFELYIAMQKAENIRNRMTDVSVTSCQIVSVSSDSHFDTIHVRITASAISYNQDLTTGKRVSGNSDRTPISFTEIWSFSRRPGAQTNADASTLEGRCPQCGSPLKIVDKAECPACQSVVNSGQYDWVLAEITQDSEWVVPSSNTAVPGWDALQEDDPGLNIQHLEDRASVIFWRSLMAVYFQDFSLVKPVLASTIDSVPKLWNPGEDIFWKTPAVGVVEVVQAVPASNDEFDRILLLVRWSATKAVGDRRSPKKLDERRIRTHVLFLKRRKGTISKVSQTFSSFSCAGCGASIDVGGSAVCVYCGAVLNDGTTDWVMEDVGPRQFIAEIPHADNPTTAEHGNQERLESSRLLNSPELLTALCRVLMVDGELHEKERRHLISIARSRDISDSQLKSIFEAAKSDEAAILVPQETGQANHFMDLLIRAALVDGKIKRSEYDLLSTAGQQVGWATADLKVAVARTRRQLYQQARRIIRSA
jgi:Tim44-like domain